MKYENIQTFIEAYECGSLVKASNALFITQGTASARLKQ